MNQNDKDKLTKLIRLAENEGASEGEARNALKKAQEIMAAHNLTRDDVDMESDNPTEKTRYNSGELFTLQRNVRVWETRLAYFICDFVHGVQYYQETPKPYRKNGIAQVNGKGEQVLRGYLVFYGPEEDVEIAKDLYLELRDAIAQLAIVKFGTYWKGDGGIYAQGFVRGLDERNEKAALEMKHSADKETYALILKSEETSLAICKGGTNWLNKEKGIRSS